METILKGNDRSFAIGDISLQTMVETGPDKRENIKEEKVDFSHPASAG